MQEPLESFLSPQDGGWLASLDWEAPAVSPLPVFAADPKSEQISLVRTIGERLKAARELCNLSQSVAAQRLGYANPSKLSKVEGATDTQSVPLWLIARAAQLYEVSSDYLLGLSDDWEAGASRGVSGWLLDSWERARRHDLELLAVLHRRVGAVTAHLPAVTEGARQVEDAAQAFRHLNPDFDDQKGSARLLASAERLNAATARATEALERFCRETRSSPGGKMEEPVTPFGAAQVPGGRER